MATIGQDAGQGTGPGGSQRGGGRGGLWLGRGGAGAGRVELRPGPGVPTDQAHIETLWGHVKTELPHLGSLTDSAVLAAELERVPAEYSGVRLHESLCYVTPNDEHQGRGEQIRRALSKG